MASFTPNYSNVKDSSGAISTPNLVISGLSASSGVAQPPRQWLMLHNPNTSADLFYNFTATPVVNGTTGSVRLPAGITQVFENSLCPQDEIKFTSGVTGAAFTIKFV